MAVASWSKLGTPDPRTNLTDVTLPLLFRLKETVATPCTPRGASEGICL